MGTRTVDVVDLFDARIHRAQWRIALYVYILERKVWQLDGQPSHGVVSFCDAKNQKCLSKFEYEEISKRAGNVPAVEQNRGLSKHVGSKMMTRHGLVGKLVLAPARTFIPAAARQVACGCEFYAYSFNSELCSLC